MSAQQLAELLAGETDGEMLTSAETHLSTCSDCQEALLRLAGDREWPIEHDRFGPPSDTLIDTLIDIEPVGNEMQVGNRSAVESHAMDRTPGLTGKLEPSRRANSLGHFGDYEILRMLGKGGMGIVYEAIADGHSDRFAIKVLRPEFAQNKLARARFLRESRNLAIVEHPNVVRILRVEEIQRLPCILMEKVDGCTLGQAIRQSGPLTVAELFHLGINIAEALQAAHSQGVVHRDIKPANVMLDRISGHVFLTDFGLAKAMQDVGLTASGTVAGTPEFMSPEQISGGPVDCRSDLFSLGTLLYYAATGVSPFRAANIIRVFRNVRSLVPPPIADGHPALCNTLARMMAKKPQERPPNAAAILEELRPCI